ncbi:uncharacterized protein N7459_002436 [Penicillium hispanicum]|uniref:uncharacterized protein n=1 Tax=Penicillium hispanicum TaxID=1080232 RepID=UPI0025412195|nr:uncharacterized protein N7459_002436 [Penicillium hispanicum]KAJ5586671.1 hypothetical protein N7459_002436 [Penicillium hispanicum]
MPNRILGTLGNKLGDILFHICYGPLVREVRQYLDKATQESLLTDLLKSLGQTKLCMGSRTTIVKNQWAIFKAHSFEDPSRQLYWNEESFHQYIQSTHPRLGEKDVVHLLWRCFYYYAFHPFPRDSANGTLNYDAFQRAVALLAASATDLFAYWAEEDCVLRPDNESYFQADGGWFYPSLHQAHFARILRSIGHRSHTSPSQEDSHPLVGETVDVLVMTQPSSINVCPDTRALRPVAQRLLGRDLMQRQYSVDHKDLSAFLALLLQLRLQEATWGLSFHFGNFEETDPQDDELARILVNGLTQGQAQEDLNFDLLLPRIMEMLPNLYLRFHQLWAVLFQPPVPENHKQQSAQHLEAPGRPDRILNAVSLFVPYPTASTLPEVKGADRRIALEKIDSPGYDKLTSTSTGLVQTLVQAATRQHVLLISGDDPSTLQPVVIGACLPSPSQLKQTAEDKRYGEMCKFKTNVSHFIFELMPQFRIFRWSGSQASVADTINIGETADLEQIAIDPAARLGKIYWLGPPNQKGTRLQVDLERKLAALTCEPDSANDAKHAGFTEVSPHENTTSQERQMSVTRIDLLGVLGTSASDNSDRVLSDRGNHQAKDLQGHETGLIRGEQLRTRIEGFGPTR